MSKYSIFAVMSIIAVTAAPGCMVRGGFSVHVPAIDGPEIKLSPGLGIIRAEQGNLFCEHVSGLNTSEKGLGLNHCGYIMPFTNWFELIGIK